MQHLIQMIWTDKKDVLLALLSGIVSGLTAVALFAQSGLLISKAALMPPFYIILILTAFLKLFGVTKSASKYAERYISHRVTFGFINKVRLHFFRKLVPQSHLLNQYKSGDLLTRITSDVETLQNFFLRVLYPPLIAILVFLATIIFTFFFSPWITLLLLLGIIMTSVIMPYVFFKLPRNSSTVERRLFAEEATEYFYGNRELQLHNQLQQKRANLRMIHKSYSVARKKELNQEQTSVLWNQLIALLISFSVVFVGAYLTANNQFEGVYLAMIILVVLTVFESAIPLSLVPTFAKHTQKAIHQLNEVTTDRTSTEFLPFKLNEAIEFNHISYCFPHVSKWSLKNINMKILRGQKVAIIGPSGSGKSTLIQLLLTEFPPTTGNIFLDDVPLQRINRTSFYEHAGVMLQQNHFFSGTIQSNLLFAHEEATEAELLVALRKAQLNKQLDNPVFEKGGNLSGGEKQRLALARLFLKNSSLLILDEPFTSIDVQTEAILYKTLLKEATEKTLILVTHRLTNLDEFDCIYVMQDAEILESGTHQQLMKKQGLYYAMKKQ